VPGSEIVFLFLGFTLLVLVGILLVLTYRERYDPLQWILVLTMFATGQVFRTGTTSWAAFLAGVANCLVAIGVVWWWRKSHRESVGGEHQS
jgi:hypothetical protein